MAVLNYTPQSGVLPVNQELTLANLAQRLSGPENALMTRGIGGILGMAQMARDYDYPDTALGLLSLPAKAVTGLGAAMMQAPAGMIDSANEQVAGLGDGSEVTEGALGMLGMGGVLGSMPRGALGANVFQGGPNKYGPEGAAKSLDYMGKGEGAQAYGYGRYDAENQGVAQDYKRKLAKGKAEVYEDGTLVPDYDDKSLDDPRSVGLNLVEGMQRHRAHLSQDEIIDAALDQAEQFIKYDPDNATGWKSGKDWLEANRGRVTTEETGYLYKHDLPDEDIARYLDWDAPLSDQPESVRKALKALGNYPDNMKGGAMYESIAAMKAEPPFDSTMTNTSNPRHSRAASEALGKAGIPGLKYYDGDNRSFPITVQAMHKGKPYGEANKYSKSQVANVLKDYKEKGFDVEVTEGTRNFVTWDQDVLNRMKLLERNGELMGVLPTPKK